MFAKQFSVLAIVAATAFAIPAALEKRAYSGQATYYEVGLGSCGQTSTDSQHIVALSTEFMANGANPNTNPKCGHTITASYQGKSVTATVLDTCQACAEYDIDLSPSAFSELAAESVGRIDVTWTYN